MNTFFSVKYVLRWFNRDHSSRSAYGNVMWNGVKNPAYFKIYDVCSLSLILQHSCWVQRWKLDGFNITHLWQIQSGWLYIFLLSVKGLIADCLTVYCIHFLHYMLNQLLYNSLSPSSPSLKTGTVFALLPSSGIYPVLHELSWIITNESEIALASAWSALGGTSSSPADLNLSNFFEWF